MRRIRFTTLIVIVVLLLVFVLAFHGSSGSAQQTGTAQGGVIIQDAAQQEATPGQMNIMADPPASGLAFISIGPEAFQPWNRTSQLTRDDTMMIRPLTPAGAQVAIDAPLHIPHGATVKQVVAYIVDNDATYDAELMLVVHGHTNTMGVSGDWKWSSGASPAMQYISITNLSSYRGINLLNYSYMVRLVMIGGANTWLNSVRVDYSFNMWVPGAFMR